MSNRLKVILIVGITAIAATALFTYWPTASNNEDAEYEKRLAELRQKQEKGKTEAAETPQTTAPASGAPIVSSINQTAQDAFQKINQILTAAPNQGTAGEDKSSRLQYLATIPIPMIQSTPRGTAIADARLDAGRPDPFAPVPSIPFPKSRYMPVGAGSGELLADKDRGPQMGSGPEGLPPPPPSEYDRKGGDLPPPPPPMKFGEGGLPTGGISVDELPQPPEKPLIVRKLKLNAIVGDRVIMSFSDRRFQKQYGYQNYITLAPGQEFDSVTLVDVEKDSVVLEENGEKATFQLDPIR